MVTPPVDQCYLDAQYSTWIGDMSNFKKMHWLYLLFFLSGFPALFYQLVWQRALFAIYGLNIEAVTMVVTAFMLGLGLGSLAGGFLSKKAPNSLLFIFALVELSISVFGYYSLHLFQWADSVTVHISGAETLWVTFALVCTPTILMGATLPLLLAFLIQSNANVGQNVGALYFVNTLGSGIACFVAAFWAMQHLGQSGVVEFAALMNACVGVAALFFAILRQYKKPRIVSFASKKETISFDLLSFPTAWVLAAVAGFIALSYEIVWIRVYGIASAGTASTFAMVLGFYLVGLAFGASLSRFYCESAHSNKQVLRVLVITILLTSGLSFLFVPALSFYVEKFGNFLFTLCCLGAIATLIGFTLPLLCHSAVKGNSSAGAGLSYLYFANIVGSAVGSFITGFIFLEYLSIEQTSLLIAILGLALAISFLVLSPVARTSRILGIVGGVCLGFLMWTSSGFLFSHVYERLMTNRYDARTPTFAWNVENRAGVINVSQDGQVFGGGVYDGAFNTDLVHDKNCIFRAYAISAFTPKMSDVLMIGLSSGSWAQVVANNPEVKRMTIVEINPGYLKLIPHYSEVASLLQNPKVHIVIDDGRRWLRRHPENQFDLIVMNTTFNWREHASNLLSVNFLERLHRALKPNGVLFYNTTNSAAAYHTAAFVYPYALRVMNFVAVSDEPIHINKERWVAVLKRYRMDGKPVFNFDNKQDRARFDELLVLLDPTYQGPPRRYGVEFKSSFWPRVKHERIITDDNMGTEWQNP
jgi:spermidine synthase